MIQRGLASALGGVLGWSPTPHLKPNWVSNPPTKTQHQLPTKQRTLAASCLAWVHRSGAAACGSQPYPRLLCDKIVHSFDRRLNGLGPVQDVLRKNAKYLLGLSAKPDHSNKLLTNNQATPYIDIVERTGSAIFDVSLKARLGDLSGLAGSSLVFGNTDPGFGLATDNVYLQGGITATFGQIGGFAITSTAISSSNNSLILRGDSGQITGSKILLDGGKIAGFDINSVGIKSSNSKLILSASGNITASNANITGDIVANTITANTAGTIAGFTINSVGIKSSNSNLILSASGNMTASNAQITGKIVAESGTIGGFNIGDDLDSAAGTLKLKGASGQITASAAQITG